MKIAPESRGLGIPLTAKGADSRFRAAAGEISEPKARTEALAITLRLCILAKATDLEAPELRIYGSPSILTPADVYRLR
jgi:hypothetical protein